VSDRLRDRIETEASQILHQRVADLRRALEEAIAQLAAPLEIPLAPGEWGAAGGSEYLRALRDAVESLARGETQREILATVLDAAAVFYRRTALFVPKEGALAGWSGLGFTGDGGFHNEDLARLKLPAAGDHLLAQALQRRALTIAGEDGPGEPVIASLGGVRPREAVAMPLLLRGRPVALLYADTGRENDPGQPLGVEIVAGLAGLAIGGLASLQGRRGRSTVAHPSSVSATISSASAMVRGGATAPPPPEEAEIQALLGEIAGHPRREGADSGMSDEDHRSHSDARRFASLLVSELLLYNEESVIHGRKNRDLLKRIEKEIERSRQAYEARVPGRIRKNSNYLDEEMVRVLAEGDKRLLGS
jgi:hypothetical protein